jgi:adenosylcobinamide hydrolase
MSGKSRGSSPIPSLRRGKKSLKCRCPPTWITLPSPPRYWAALVTAGAKVNAQRAGVDEGTYIEGDEHKGTVNILILTNVQLRDGAMARALITITEAKTAAFEDLRRSSSYTGDVQATGTGTDCIIIATGTDGPKITYTGDTTGSTN